MVISISRVLIMRYCSESDSYVSDKVKYSAGLSSSMKLRRIEGGGMMPGNLLYLTRETACENPICLS